MAHCDSRSLPLQRELDEVRKEGNTLANSLKVSADEAIVLRSKLAASEAKVERMKEAEHIFEKDGCVDLPKASSHFIVTIRRILSEPPSTPLDLYHKERNKKELGEVEGRLNFALVAPTRDQMTQRIEEAPSTLKRLTE